MLIDLVSVIVLGDRLRDGEPSGHIWHSEDSGPSWDIGVSAGSGF